MEVRIEKKEDGSYIAYSENVPGLVAIGTGETVSEAKDDFMNSLEELAEDMTEAEKAQKITEPIFHFDLSSLFEYYKVINVSAFARMFGMNDTLLRQYKKGNTYVSDAQIARIEDNIHKLGVELATLKLT